MPIYLPMVDFLKPEERSKLMSRIRGRDTKPEMLVRKLLHRLGYRYRIHDRTLPGSPDLVFHRRARAIFIHGCFWHGHHCQKRDVETLAPFWRDKIRGNQDRDARTGERLLAEGWEVLVLWECELKIKEMPNVERRLTKFLGPTTVPRKPRSVGRSRTTHTNEQI
jgi:DNA mismatch endonuclease, patch repair protein